MKRRLGLPAAVLALAIGCSPAPDERTQPRLVLLYATCTVNKDFLSPYDAGVPFTPNLDRFAREGVVFRRHVTEAGVSGIAYASLFAGVQADRHRVFRHPQVLSDDLYLLTEAYADAGYETYFWNSHRMASPNLQYAQGVSRDNGIMWYADLGRILNARDRRLRAILDRLEREPDYRACIVFNFTVTHAAYSRQITPEEISAFLADHPDECDGVTQADLDEVVPFYEEHRLALQWDFPAAVERLEMSPEEIDRYERVVSVLYKVGIRKLDQMFGATVSAIDERGLGDVSLIAFTADHGEILYRDNALYHWGHGLQLVPEVLNAPWVLRGAGLAPGDYAGVTRTIDVFPTLAGLSHVSIPEDAGVEGVDLSAVLREDRDPPRLLGFSHTKVLGPQLLEQFAQWENVTMLYPREDPELMWVSVRDADMTYKLRHLGSGEWVVEAFDLATDPEERLDLFDPENEAHRVMRVQLERYKAQLVAAYGAESGLTSEEIEARLRALGYIR